MLSNNKIKIGIFVETFPVVSETFIVNKILYLFKMGYDVRIFCLKESVQWKFFPDLIKEIPDVRERVRIGLSVDSLSDYWIALNRLVSEIVLHPLSTLKFLAYNLFQSNNKFLTPVEKVFQRFNFNGVNLDILSIEFDTLGYKVVDLKSLLKCKIFINTVGVAQATNTYQKNPKILTYLNDYSDMFRFASRFLENNSFKLGFNKGIKNKVIYCGANPFFDIENTANLNKPKHKKFKITSVARLAWSKGYEFALEAVALAQKSGLKIQYTIIGDGPYKDAIYYAAEQLGLIKNNTVIFKGALSLKEIRKELGNSNMFLQTSVIEGFGISVLEAQLMGLPVVVTNVGGLIESVVNQKTGLIAQKRDAEDIADKIIYLYKNKEKSSQMGRNGKQSVRDNFTLKMEMESLAKSYLELLKN